MELVGNLIPVRDTGCIECLVGQRAYFDPERTVDGSGRNVPNPYAGELAFIGGKGDPGESLCMTVEREFREETGYTGGLHIQDHVGSLRSGRYELHYFTGTLDDRLVEGDMSAELLSVSWKRPSDVLDILTDPRFTAYQNMVYDYLGLGDTIYGDYALPERDVDVATQAVLSAILSSSDRIRRVAGAAKEATADMYI
jgi:8-oxo-dGTP pyrophosphatase MutT (NUDIX family)